MKAQNTKEEDNFTTWLLDPGTNKETKDDGKVQDIPPLWFSKRLLVTVLLFLCFLNSALIRSNVNIAVVDMTSNQSFVRGNLNFTKSAEFDWDSATVGVILSTFSYGALLSFFGAIPAAIFGPSLSCTFAIFIMGFTTLLHPIALYLNFYLFLGCRFLAGLFEGFFNVSTAEIFIRWIPQTERSTLVSFSFNGANVGFAIAYPILGFISYLFGWKMIFYVTGAVSIILSIIMLICVRNQPYQDRWISKEELRYITHETNLYVPRHMVIHPYKKIFTSSAVWALLAGKFIHGWIISIVNVYFPIYVKDFTQTSTDEVGLISSIPGVVYIFMFPIAGTFMYYWKMNGKQTMTQIHKIIMSLSLVTSAILLIAIVIVSNFTVSLIIFVVIQIFMAFVILILELITVSLAPNDTSIIAGLSTFMQAVSSIISRTVIGFIITNHSLQEWNNCFLLTTFVLIIGAVIFIAYGSSEPQPWSLKVYTTEIKYSSFDGNENKPSY